MVAMLERHVTKKAWAFSKDTRIPLRTGTGCLHSEDDQSFENNPARDFGGLQHKVPSLVFSPRSLDQAQALLGFLNDEALPYKLRGAAHSPGGEVLIDAGVVVDTRGLSAPIRTVATDIAQVQGGTRWLQVCESLSLIGMAPQVLTDNLHTSVAGTLSVGGFGDSSHLRGLQIDGVQRATLLLPNGSLRRVDRSDPLLAYALASHGQLGLIAEASLVLWKRPRALHARLWHFARTTDFIDAALDLTQTRGCDYLRAWAHGEPPHEVTALVGRYGSALPTTPAHLRIAAETAPDWIDPLSQVQGLRRPQWPRFNPALEAVLPLPDGLPLLAMLDDVARGLGRGCFPRGYALLLLRGRTTQSSPLSPLPDSPWALVVALRPECHTQNEALAAQAQLIPLVQRIVDAGGRIYLTSFPLSQAMLRSQHGDHIERLRTLKRSVDPRGLCNRGAYFGLDAD